MNYLPYRAVMIVVALGFLFAAIKFLESDYMNWYGSNVYLGKGRYVVSFALFILFLISAYIGLRKRFNPAFMGKSNYLKCVSCGKVFAEYTLAGKICPDCKGNVEKLEGFFERNPSKR